MNISYIVVLKSAVLAQRLLPSRGFLLGIQKQGHQPPIPPTPSETQNITDSQARFFPRKPILLTFCHLFKKMIQWDNLFTWVKVVSLMWVYH